METTETTELTPDPTPDMVLTQEAKYLLHTAGRWATFLGIMGFIGAGIIALLAFFVGTIFTAISKLNPMASGMPFAASGFITFIYLLIAVFYFFIAYYLYQFGVNIKSGTLYNDTIQTTKAFRNLKSHFKLIGITSIVVISFYILFFIIGIIVLIAGISHHHNY